MRIYKIIAASFCLSFCCHQFAEAQPFVVAFGSCGHQEKPLHTLELAASLQPDVFVFLGDNIYGDTRDLPVLKKKYEMLNTKLSFQKLKQSTRLLATWDDHDYGENDAGRHYPLRVESKALFLDFWAEPANSERRKRNGIYTAEYFKHQGKTIQFILLDMRTFRDNLNPYKGEFRSDKSYFYELDYAPYEKADSTLLGKEQWDWLEATLKSPADLRIIASSTQFAIEYNGYESWANFPHEQKRMFDLLKSTRAEGVFFLSGDVHYSEISKIQVPGAYPLFDFTSSGLSQSWFFATPNQNRIEGPVMENHIGLIKIDFEKKGKEIQLECIDHTGNSRFEYAIPLRILQFEN